VGKKSQVEGERLQKLRFTKVGPRRHNGEKQTKIKRGPISKGPRNVVWGGEHPVRGGRGEVGEERGKRKSSNREVERKKG